MSNFHIATNALHSRAHIYQIYVQRVNYRTNKLPENSIFKILMTQVSINLMK